MELTVWNERERTTLNLNFTGNTVQELLQHLKVNPETILVVRNQEVITEKEILREKDALKLLSVISGG
ncbi:MoaD/ThiS family protein, partial [Candidatus Woesearchaeota archaeon]|nr:MoaD/ThiS family protein [Candidatus Woesearchaeota archaeon]